jgi:hypothetical protein
MDCFQFHNLIQQRLDGAWFDRGAWDLHVAECPECRSRELAVLQLEGALGRRTLSEPPTGLSERIVRRVLHDRSRVLRYRRSFAVAGLLAASLVLVVYLGPSRQGRDQTGPRVAANKSSNLEGGASPVLLQRSVQEAGLALTGLVGRTTDETIESSRLLLPQKLPVSVLPSAELWQGPWKSPIHSLRQAGQGVSEGLKPLATSAQRAVNLFWDEYTPSEQRNLPESSRERGG